MTLEVLCTSCNSLGCDPPEEVVPHPVMIAEPEVGGGAVGKQAGRMWSW